MVINVLMLIQDHIRQTNVYFQHINDVCTLNDMHCGQTIIVRIRKQSKFGLIVSYVDHVTSPNIVHVYGDYVTARYSAY